MESHFFWHALEIDSVAHELKTDIRQGLSNKEALSRHTINGRNELPEEYKTPISYTFLRIAISTMLPILLISIAYLIFLWYSDNKADSLNWAITIFGFLMVGLVLSIIQEIKAYRSLYFLRKLAKDAIYSKALRNGHIVSVRTNELVPGDIIYFEAGDQIPADGRIIDSNNLVIDESLITSLKGTVRKDEAVINKDLPLHQRNNMVYMKSMVISGKGKAIVTATGKNTQVFQESDGEETIIQGSKFESELSKHSGWYILVCIILSLAVTLVVLLLIKNPDITNGIMIGLSLLMSAWPAGLIEAIALAFAIGMKRLNDNHIIIRNLPKAEKLADVALICCNKKGIMTQNQMRAKKIFVDGEIIDIEDDVYDPDSNIPLTDSKSVDLPLLLTVASLCNNSEVRKSSEGWEIDGDSTEGSLIITAMKGGINKDELSLALTKIVELPYDPKRKRATIIFKDNNGEIFAFTCGAYENILDVCVDIQLHGYLETLNSPKIRATNSVNSSFARDRAQSIAFAYSPIEGDPRYFTINNVERDMIFIGMIGLVDVPRIDTKQAVKKCLLGSVRPVLLTDDSKDIAIGFAKDIGIARSESEVLTGEELDTLDEKSFFDIHDRFSVYADISPSQKTRIIRTLKETGQIIAMIGDSSNDADAIEEADVGLSAGETGTSVSINASDIVIMDNSFSTAVKAIEGTRNTLQNAKKILRYFLSGSIATASTIIISLIINRIWNEFHFPPLHLFQVLWINLVAIIIPSFGIIFNPMSGNTLEDGTYIHGKIFSNELKTNILIRGILSAIFAIIVYAFSLGPTSQFTDQYRANTAAMSILVISQLAFAFQCCRSTNKGLFGKIFGTRLMLGLVIFVLALQISVVYIPYLNEIFKTTPLSVVDWIPIIIAFAIFWLPLDELFTSGSEYEETYEEKPKSNGKKKINEEKDQKETVENEEDFWEE